MQKYREGPPTVAAPIGREGAKLLQRFNELGSANRKRLLGDALGMIERQRDEGLSTRDREAKRLVDRVAHILDLLETGADQTTIQSRVTRGMLDDHRAELARMGITYFGGMAHA